jgi:hypothetical protein
VHLRKRHPKIGQGSPVLRFRFNNSLKENNRIRDSVNTLKDERELIRSFSRLGLKSDVVLEDWNRVGISSSFGKGFAYSECR